MSSPIEDMDVAQQEPDGYPEATSDMAARGVGMDSGLPVSAATNELFTYGPESRIDTEVEFAVNINTEVKVPITENMPEHTEATRERNGSEEGAVERGFEVGQPSSGVASDMEEEQGAAGAISAAPPGPPALNEAAVSPDHAAVLPNEERGADEYEDFLHEYGIPQASDMDVNEPPINLAGQRMCTSAYFRNCATCMQRRRGSVNYPCCCVCNCIACAPLMTRCALCQGQIWDFTFIELEDYRTRF